MDTIAAISSAVGPGARMILRLSGAASISIAKRLSDAIPCAQEAARVQLAFRELQFPAWAYLFQSPRSYTGEDLVEFHIPGNVVLADLLLAELLAGGARLAEPGEFTARAYFNGRIDLTEAEGVAASISASNEQELAAARRLMAGELARRLAPITDLITQTLALTEVGIDFSDDDVSFLSATQARQQINHATIGLDQLLSDSVRFERLAHEPLVVLVGRPNAGKSTLLNALAGQQRAVVSSVAGTTRDALSVELALKRGVVRLVDVAGIEQSEQAKLPAADDPAQERIERLMREKAIRTVERADIVLLVVEHGDSRPQIVLPREPDWIVRTKADLCAGASDAIDHQISVSAIALQGLEELKAIIDRFAFGEASTGNTLAINTRHVRAIEEARAALERALNQVEGGAELLALELRESLDVLGTVSGIITPDDVLSRVFSAFCIGK